MHVTSVWMHCTSFRCSHSAPQLKAEQKYLMDKTSLLQMQGKHLSKTLGTHRSSVHLYLIRQLFSCLQSRPQSCAARSAAPSPAAHTHGHAGASTRTHHHLHSSLVVQLEPFWVPPQCCEDAVTFLFHRKPPTASHRGFAHTSKHMFVLQWEH